MPAGRDLCMMMFHMMKTSADANADGVLRHVDDDGVNWAGMW